MGSINKLLVSIYLGNELIEVGELVSSNRRIHFKYHSQFLEKGINISPIKLPLTKGIHTGEVAPFDGLFGVFNDSLPDGWGRLLLDRKLISQGVSLNDVSPLDRLAYVGKNGKGALIYTPDFSDSVTDKAMVDLSYIANEVAEVIEGASSEIIDKLFTMGGASGGARPKIFIGYNPLSGDLIYGAEELPEGYEAWMIKFPSSIDPKDIANIEFAYHKMATEAGLEMMDCKLFEGKDGRMFFSYNGWGMHIRFAFMVERNVF